MNFRRVFIEKKKDFNLEEKTLIGEIREYLKITSIENVRILNIYDLVNMKKEEEEKVINEILYETPIDIRYDGQVDIQEDEKFFRVEILKGQFNQREESLKEMIAYIIDNKDFDIVHSKLLIFKGIDQEELEKIKKYYVNPLEMNELDLAALSLRVDHVNADENSVEGFIGLEVDGIAEFKEKYAIGMDQEDILFCQEYFRDREEREPSITELKLIDTYWSDHCRHTTFMTEIREIKTEENYYNELFQKSIDKYIESRNFVYGETDRVISLMDLATINMKETKKKGLLEDKEDSKEVNAASIVIDVDVDGKDEKYLLMFKNETHNHPTEMEPFGGASTCLGGAIRDPLSGRAYVYQAMRITGSADPREEFESTLEGKLPQRKITRTAMEGYSSYGYEIGAATGYVREIYDEGYKAKRMEVGALVATAPVENVYRGSAEPGDLVVLIGGRTGKDGVGGAVGSSKKHTEDSFDNSGAEVQKGNAAVERKIVRLYRRKEVSKLIKICNDFGAGGVSVAIGELADGLDINLDVVPLKNHSLNGMEIALSESQERMAAVVAEKDIDLFLEYCREEDVEATIVAKVTEEKVLKMTYKGEEIVHIQRDFLDTNGIRKKNNVELVYPEKMDLFNSKEELTNDEIVKKMRENLRDLNITSQKGLIEHFDSSVGGETVLMPLGGKNQITQAEGMVAKLPVMNGKTNTCSMMSYGFDPMISKWSPYHGGYFAVVESLAKIVAMGGDVSKTRLSFQEYFERIDKDSRKWSKPFLALLGAYEVQRAFDTPAIGGKDSMSGTFEDLNVAPTLISFAVNYDKVENILSPEFKNIDSEVGVFKFKIDENGVIDLEELKETYKYIKELVDKKLIISASTVKNGGMARSICEMALGNDIGFEFTNITRDLFDPLYGSILVELSVRGKIDSKNYEVLGYTRAGGIIIGQEELTLEEAKEDYVSTLEEVFPLAKTVASEEVEKYEATEVRRYKEKLDEVKVFIPIFKGTFGEYTMEKAFREAGALVKSYVFETLDLEQVDSSYEKLSDYIRECDILALPDGMVMGSEPESSSKFMKIVFNNPLVKAAVEDHIGAEKLILGIGNGFDTLIKLGLIQYGRYTDVDENSLYITMNENTGFISSMLDVKLQSNLSPFMKNASFEEVYRLPIATKEGRIIGEDMNKFFESGQVASVFKDNISGSTMGIEAMSSPDGRIFGCICGIDRVFDDLYINTEAGNMNVFKSAVEYFRK